MRIRRPAVSGMSVRAVRRIWAANRRRLNDTKMMQQSDFSELRQAVCQIVAAVPGTGHFLRGRCARALGRPGWARLVGRREAAYRAKLHLRPTGRRQPGALAAQGWLRRPPDAESARPGVQVAGDRIVGWRKVFWDCKGSKCLKCPVTGAPFHWSPGA